MQNIREKIKNMLYVCKRWYIEKFYIISVWGKNKIVEIKEKKIKNRIAELWMFQKKQMISAIFVLLTAIVGITTVTIYSQKNKTDIRIDNTDSSNKKVEVLLEAKLPSGKYVIKKINGETKLYIDGDTKKSVNYDKLPVMYFDMNASASSDDVLKVADADHTDDVGGQVYRGKRIYAERFYSFLLSHGYTNKAYIITGSYLDAYFENDGQLSRFLYIKKTEDTGVLIFGECENKVPASIKKIIKEK